MYTFTKVPFSEINVEEFNSFPDKHLLTTKQWISFVQEDSKASPYILRITCNSTFVGYFSALIVSKFGVKILASPFSGWSTAYMGLDVYDQDSKTTILPELIDFVFKDTNCWFFQMVDRDIDVDSLRLLQQCIKKYKMFSEIYDTLDLDINGDDAFLFKNMKVDCRNFIRQFERRGAMLEVVSPTDEFAEDYFNQLKDVFAKQSLVPTYNVDKVKCLLRHLSKTNDVLCLRVRDPEGKSIATSIFPAFNKKMFFWGGASLRGYQHYRPNEYMIYYAIKYWRDKGCTMFDMVGNRSYKKKFGSKVVRYPIIIIPKYSVLVPLRRLAAKLYYLSGSILWKFKINRQ